MNICQIVAVLGAVLLVSGCSPENEQDARKDDRGSSPLPLAAEGPLQRKPSANGAAVRFTTLEDGAIVSSPLLVEFAVSGMDLMPAGRDAPNSGHHHILIDSDLPDMNMPIPADARHVHFGDGSTKAELTLAPGQHTLQLLFADYLHIPHDVPVYSEQITITVQ